MDPSSTVRARQSGPHPPTDRQHADASASPGRRLIAFRRQKPAIVHGAFELLAAHHEHLYAFIRRYEEIELMCLANFSDVPVEQAPRELAAHPPAHTLVLGNYAARKHGLSQPFLRPWEVQVWGAALAMKVMVRVKVLLQGSCP